jgi:hypothetical protein
MAQPIRWEFSLDQPRSSDTTSSDDERTVATGMKLMGIGVAIMILAGLLGAHT